MVKVTKSSRQIRVRVDDILQRIECEDLVKQKSEIIPGNWLEQLNGWEKIVWHKN